MVHWGDYAEALKAVYDKLVSIDNKTKKQVKKDRDLTIEEYGAYGATPQQLTCPTGKRWIVYAGCAEVSTDLVSLKVRSHIGGDKPGIHVWEDSASNTKKYGFERLPVYLKAGDYVKAEAGSGNVMLLIGVLEYTEGEEYS